MKTIDESRTKRFFDSMYWPKKRRQYEKFIEAEEAKYKAQQEEKLLASEEE